MAYSKEDLPVLGCILLVLVEYLHSFRMDADKRMGQRHVLCQMACR